MLIKFIFFLLVIMMPLELIVFLGSWGVWLKYCLDNINVSYLVDITHAKIWRQGVSN